MKIFPEVKSFYWIFLILLLTSVMEFDIMLFDVSCSRIVSLEGVVFCYVICAFRDSGGSCFDFDIYSYFI